MLNRVLTNRAHVIREVFDPKKKTHRESLKRFLETGNWGQVQFFPEEPCITVPETVLRKFALSKLGD